MSANDIPAVVRQLSQPGIIELGAFPPSPLTATFVQAVYEECHPFLASVLCRNESMRWRRYTGRRHKRHARYRRGREGVRPRLRGRR